MGGSKVVAIRRADQSYMVAGIIGISRSVASFLYEVRVDNRIDEDAVDRVVHMACSYISAVHVNELLHLLEHVIIVPP